MKLEEGFYYSQYSDETWEEALAAHEEDGGFQNIQAAIIATHNDSGRDFKIFDHLKREVFDSKSVDSNELYIRSLCLAGHYYVKINDESLLDAVNSHSVGYRSVEEAIEDTLEQGNAGDQFQVYSHELSVVHTGQIK